MNRSLLFPLVCRVASKTQLRKKLAHPGKLRLLRAAGIDPSPEVAPLTYIPTYVPETISSNGWSPAPPSPIMELPFHVKRTSKGLQLPVYRDYRNGNTRVLTILRKYTGDENTLASEMQKVCGGKNVSVRPGRIEVVGNFARPIKEWLVGLGF